MPQRLIGALAAVAALATPLAAQSPDSIPVDTAAGSLAPITVGLRAPVRSIGSSRRSLDSSDVRFGSRPRTLSELLQARVPGVSVLRYGGDPSDGSRVRVRGTTSLVGDAAPVVVIDGVPVYTPELLGSTGALVSSSRFDDFEPEEVERIDVLAGPAATTLFGARASNGAIVISTKRGVSGAPRWRAWTYGALSAEPTTYPANFHQNGTDPSTGNPAANCDVVAIANLQCNPTTLDVWNPLESASPFRQGQSGGGGASIAGGPFGIRAYASAIGRAETAALDSSRASRVNGRLNAERELFGRLTIGGSVGYVNRRATLRSDDVVIRGLLGTAVDDANRGYLPLTTDAPTTDRRGDRLSRSARVEWRALSWLRVHGTAGRDELTQRDFALHPFGVGEPPVLATRRHWLASSIVHGTAEARHRASASVGLRTVVSYEEAKRRSVDEENLTRGDLFSYSTRWRRSDLRSWMVQERVDIRDRIFVNVGARRITVTEWTTGEGRWHPVVDAAWDLGRVRGVSALRLRGAYAFGVPPRDTTSLIFVAASPFSPATPLEPEEPREGELGLDARFGTRLQLDATFFAQHTPRLIAPGPLSPSSGTGFPTAVLADMHNHGLELVAHLNLIDRPDTRWGATLTLGALRNRVRNLAGPPLVFTGPGIRDEQPFGVYVKPSVTFVDANGDNLPVPSELTVGEARPSGAGIPTREISLRTTLAFPQGGLVLSGALDHRGGHRAYNLFDYYQCAFDFVCRALQDPSVPLAEKVTAVAARYGAVRTLYLESATYTRLGELTLEWTPAARFAAAISRGVTISIEGRNLVTWTRYRGPDPEVATATARRSFQDPPMLPALPRTIGLRVELAPR